MKKNYIRPIMDTIKIKNQQLLAGSPSLSGTYDDSTDPILGREFDEINALLQ